MRSRFTGTVVFITMSLCSPAFKMQSSTPGNDQAIIINSGSTNTAGFRIKVDRSAGAVYTQIPRRFGSENHEKPEPVHKKLPAELVHRFYSDMEKVKPFSSLPESHCMKSASFGFTLTVEFRGEKTSDLSCGHGGNPALQDLIRDVNEIVMLCDANAGMRRGPRRIGP